MRSEDIQHCFSRADDFMEAGRPAEAATDYGAAFAQMSGVEGLEAHALRLKFPPRVAFWRYLAFADAAIQAGNAQLAVKVIRGAFGLAKAGIQVVGNPYFHLKAGQTKWLLAEDPRAPGPGSPQDELARALIGGGIDLLDGAWPDQRAFILQVMKPPQGLTSWEQTRGRGGATSGELANALGWARTDIERLYRTFPPPDPRRQ